MIFSILSQTTLIAANLWRVNILNIATKLNTEGFSIPWVNTNMCWDPYTKNTYVDARYQSGSTPLDMICFPFVEHYDRASVNNNLHEKLDLKDPESN